MAAPAFAQDQTDPPSSQNLADGLIPDEGRLILDVAEARANQDRDIVQDQRCDDQIDASRIANEIIVCRDLGKATDGAWNKADWERRYAKRTQGPKPVQVDGSGLQLPGEGSLIAITVTVRNVCAIPPCAPEPAILIDVGALPEAPPGSDADRVARGLPPLNEDRAETLDAIKRLQAELGLPAPSLVASE